MKRTILLTWLFCLLSVGGGFVSLTLSNAALVRTLGLPPQTRFQTSAGSQAFASQYRPRLAAAETPRKGLVRLLQLDTWFAASVLLAVLVGAHLATTSLPPLASRRTAIAVVLIPLALLSGVGDLLENYLLYSVYLGPDTPTGTDFTVLSILKRVKLVNFLLLPLTLVAGAAYLLRNRRRA